MRTKTSGDGFAPLATPAKKMLKNMNYLFTSESVSEGHPDKVADQISDAILDEFLRQDPESKVACETFCSTGLVIVGGEVTSEAYVDIQGTVRDVIKKIGYTKAEYMFDSGSCGVLSQIHSQSPDIYRGVSREDPEDQGAGDQGMMFGYACKATEDYMPLALYLSHLTLKELADIRHNELHLMPYLRPDSKAQYTIEFDENDKPVRIHTIVLSTQHDEFDSDEAMRSKIEADVRNILLPRVISKLKPETAALFKGDFILHVRKIIVDTYGGRAPHGGGAFSGKDPSKVDRSAAYAARYIAKNMVAAGVADEMVVQIAYAIGVAQPVSIYVNTKGTGIIPDAEIADKIGNIFDLRPAAIIRKFGLKNPIYGPTAAYGHFGREPYTEVLELTRGGKTVKEEVQFFGWSKKKSSSSVGKNWTPSISSALSSDCNPTQES